MLFTNFSARDAFPSFPPQPLFVSLSVSKLFHLIMSNRWSAGDHLENHNNGLPLETATWDFCSFLSCRDSMQDILWFIFPFLIRYERIIKRIQRNFHFLRMRRSTRSFHLRNMFYFRWHSGFIKWENYFYCYFCLMLKTRFGVFLHFYPFKSNYLSRWI